MKAKSNSELVICDGAYTELMMQENWLYESHVVEAGPRPTAQARNSLTVQWPGSRRPSPDFP